MKITNIAKPRETSAPGFVLAPDAAMQRRNEALQLQSANMRAIREKYGRLLKADN